MFQSIHGFAKRIWLCHSRKAIRSWAVSRKLLLPQKQGAHLSTLTRRDPLRDGEKSIVRFMAKQAETTGDRLEGDYPPFGRKRIPCLLLEILFLLFCHLMRGKCEKFVCCGGLHRHNDFASRTLHSVCSLLFVGRPIAPDGILCNCHKIKSRETTIWRNCQVRLQL